MLSCLPFQVLPVSTLLSICFLVCWLSREALMASDLLTAALHGVLPYLDMPQRCRHLVEEAGSPLAATLLAPMHGHGGKRDDVRRSLSPCLISTVK